MKFKIYKILYKENSVYKTTITRTVLPPSLHLYREYISFLNKETKKSP